MNTMGGYTLLRRISSNSDFSRLKNRPAEPGQQYQPTDVEHLANVISHGVWILPSVLALIFMVCVSVNGLQVTTTLVYGSALVLLFSTSTIFHILSYTGQFPLWRRTFHIGDRAVIYIFIASSYTPWLLLKEFHSWSEEFLCLVWGMALLGVSYAYLYHEKYKFLEIIFYLIIGVCPAICIMDMKDLSGLVELSIGGAMYIFGVVFFKMDGVIPFAHAIWHCFVFVGSFCHFVAICSHLLGVNLPGF
ncbi:monocyte to macrophage differentiation factor 2-like isoform X1 [Biomphalaria glabrata]|uniref:Monocyte to macrophage differentiation factor 2-like isoform X1 n=1 Tax=Biomphalaria glabrata TaxID=6526 RepID=A0A9W2ZI40_BIOGL|nr:monocyte to macrophage differentiation factor 2-like isoform X1 [Biomphalaria glabrata]KAI8795043.1 monocyte to macrophage differentiation factor 2 [Biomphalaria glabrata]